MNEAELFRQLGALFAQTSHRLFLVGGSVRDRQLGRASKDLDFTTSMLPDDIHKLLAPWADDIWDIGREFGTIAARKDGHDVEITTFRTDGPGRKPEVVFTDDLTEDLRRRDFTINAMALPVTAEGLDDRMHALIDPFGGFMHGVMQIIDTPRPPEQSFNDDPLRMMRAARFASQLDFEVASRVGNAMQGMAHRIDDISRERVAAELDKLLMGINPQAGLFSLQAAKLMQRVLPDVSPFARFGFDDDIAVRWARLLQDLTAEEAGKLLKGLKFSNLRVDEVAKLVSLNHRFAPVVINDRNLRHLVHEAGEVLTLALELFADEELSLAVGNLLVREGVPALPLNGKEVMAHLSLRPGKIVGQAMDHLWSRVLDHGPLDPAEAKAELAAWALANDTVLV